MAQMERSPRPFRKGRMTIREGRVDARCFVVAYAVCADKSLAIDYKDLRTISQFVTERGKMTPSRITGNCARHSVC